MKEDGFIDWGAFGTLLKASRVSQGYSRGQFLCDAIKEKTGMRVSERTIYALEEGTRTPSTDIFIALQQVLPELRDPEYLKALFPKNNITVAIVEF
ncbi:MAG: helix-turn-helix transcriptional regulator [Adlercreutzia sp.]|uniref:helix-turn-helix domain-containing protein n=1 Tax=uncultured Adlercreutzia sp. TaxID=875803 RepID=UPI00217259D7|nr:helix-turn-helix transcriptional regulator [uncultured Adlercreutzia sp.]MCI8425309.1 helix-turn-helix transcriptional regulator [Adlercreutzia sp.]